MQHKAVFFSVILVIVLVFSARLYNIQIQNDDMLREQSEMPLKQKNYMRQEVTYMIATKNYL